MGTRLVVQTIDRCFARKDDNNQLKALVGVLQVSKHWFHLVRLQCILAETRLAHNGHSCVR